MSTLAVTSVTAVCDALQSIAKLNGKVFPVLTEEELHKLCDYIPMPGIGVVYEGTTTRRDEDQRLPGAAQGNVQLALVIFYKVENVLGPAAGEAYRTDAIELLDTVRKEMFKLRVMMRPWSFKGENNPLQRGSLTMWIQRWELPVILT